MDEENTENEGSSILQAFAALALLLISIAGLWINEVRFDLPAAARDTEHQSGSVMVENGQNISYTGRVDPNLFIAGEYVIGFKGYIGVKRIVETYAWDHKRNKPDVLKWQENPDNTSANDSLISKFEYKLLTPPIYELGALTISATDIHFGNALSTIPPSSLQWINRRDGVRSEGDYFYYSSNGGSLGSPQFGDQRIRYIGLDADGSFTYFGRFEDGRGRADTSQRNLGMLNEFLRNDGILHHLVKGNRLEALQTLKAKHEEIKTVIRWGGTALVCASIYAMLYYALSMFLFIPIVGWVIEFGTFIAGIVIGIPLSLTVIALGYLVAHPLLLLAVIVGIGAGYRVLRSRDRSRREKVKTEVASTYALELATHSVAELEFLEFVHANTQDGQILPESRVQLFELGETHDWPMSKIDQLIEEALSKPTKLSAIEQLKALIKLALADGKLSTLEVKMIRSTSQRAGLTEQQTRELIKNALSA